MTVADAIDALSSMDPDASLIEAVPEADDDGASTHLTGRMRFVVFRDGGSEVVAV